jgi:drug/metabolite transporter (DMT)-like permease
MDTCRLKGILSLIAATLFFSVMIVLAKLATQTLPATEVPVARYAFGLLAIILASWLFRFDLLGHDRKLLFLSGLTGGIGAYFFIVALGYAPLGVVVVISFTFPVFAAITAHIFLKERIPISKLPAVVLPFAGVVMVMGIGLGKFSAGKGELFALLDGMFTGLSITIIRKLRERESASSIFFYFCLIGLLLAVPIALPSIRRPTVNEAFLLAGMAAFALLGRVTMNYGFKFCQATEGSILATFQIPMMAVIGWLAFDEPMHYLAVLGSVLIVGSCFWIMYQPKGKPLPDSLLK